MKKLIALAIFVGIPLLGAMWWFSTYNSIKNHDEAVRKAYGEIQVVLQAANDKIPGLVAIVEKAASAEKDTLVAVTQARASASQAVQQAKVDPNVKLTPTEEKAVQERLDTAQQQLRTLMISVQSTVERYPTLKSQGGFRTLQTQFEGAINRIAQERRVAQERIETYNSQVRDFPAIKVATYYGFETRPYFTAKADAQDAPVPSFK